MSLIQEALRRQQEEMEADKHSPKPTDSPQPSDESPQQTDRAEVPDSTKGPEAADRTAPQPQQQEPEKQAPTPTPPPSNTNPLPSDTPPSPEKTEPPAPLRRNTSDREQRVLGPLLTVLLVIILLGGAFIWAVWWGYGVLTATEDPELEPTPTVAESPDPTEEVEDESTDIPETAPETEAEEMADVDTTTEEEVTIEPEDPEEEDVVVDSDVADPEMEEPPEPTETVTEVDEPDALADAEDPDVDEEAEEETAELPDPDPEPIIWPDLQISGVMGTGDGGSAIINGKVLGAGETIGDVEVKDFGRGFVVLEYRGETRRFSVGRSTR